MALLDRLTRSPIRGVLTGMAGEVADMREQLEDLAESAPQAGAGLAALRQEDVGWRNILGGLNDTDEMDVQVLKDHAVQARALRAMNPIVKRGIVVRNAYIWQQDIIYPEAAQSIVNDPINEAEFFGQEAREELEAAYATEGQYFILADPRKRQVRRIPFSEITGIVTNPEHRSEIWYYRRTYTRTVTDNNGHDKATTVEVYYPSITYKGPYRSRINGIKVDKSKAIEHSRVNSSIGFRYGVPDLLGAVYWARAYKEYLEASYTLAKALARLAFKVSNTSNKGAKAVAARLAGPVDRSEAGSTVALGAGQDLQAINKSGSSVDFEAGTPLAAMVAAALDIPLSVVLTDGSAGGRQGAEAALEDPTIKTMNLRRQTHLDSRIRILRYFGVTDSPVWHELDGALLHRRLQSIKLAQDTGMLHDEEVRSEVIRTLSIITDRAVDDIPEPKETPTEDSPGPLSDGTNDSRDNPSGATDA